MLMSAARITATPPRFGGQPPLTRRVRPSLAVHRVRASAGHGGEADPDLDARRRSSGASDTPDSVKRSTEAEAKQDIEPSQADGEGQGFSMSEVSANTGGGSKTDTAAGPGATTGQNVEPSPADGEGPGFSMSDVSAHTGGNPKADTAATSASAGAAASAPPQDGHYHFSKGDEVKAEEADGKVDVSWTSLEEPEAVERAPPPGSSHPPPPKYVGEPEEGVGYREPGQDIASALPGRRGDTGDYGLSEQ